MTALPNFDADLTGDTPTEPAEAFRVTDESTAGWCVRKIRQANDHIADREALYRQHRDRIDAELHELDRWFADVTADDRRTIERMESYLEGYTRDLADADPKFTSLKLPGVVLKRVKGRTSTEVTDMDAFAAWAAATGYGYLVRRTVTEAVDRKALTAAQTIAVHDGRYVDSTNGEVIPGVEAVAGDDRFEVQIEALL